FPFYFGPLDACYTIIMEKQEVVQNTNRVAKRVQSLTKLFLINVNRVTDHLIRFASGLPTMKRSKITPEIYLGGQYNTSGLKKLKSPPKSYHTKKGIERCKEDRSKKCRDKKIQGHLLDECKSYSFFIGSSCSPNPVYIVVICGRLIIIYDVCDIGYIDTARSY